MPTLSGDLTTQWNSENNLQIPREEYTELKWFIPSFMSPQKIRIFILIIEILNTQIIEGSTEQDKYGATKNKKTKSIWNNQLDMDSVQKPRISTPHNQSLYESLNKKKGSMKEKNNERASLFVKD